MQAAFQRVTRILDNKKKQLKLILVVKNGRPKLKITYFWCYAGLVTIQIDARINFYSFLIVI